MMIMRMIDNDNNEDEDSINNKQLLITNSIDAS